jgi:hypothetical protein
MNHLASFLQSSQDPSQVANKVKGAILAVSSIIIFLAGQLFGVTLTSNDVLDLATQIGTIAGLVWSLYGVILAVVTRLGKLSA